RLSAWAVKRTSASSLIVGPTLTPRAGSEPCLAGDRVRPLADREHALDKGVAPVPRRAAVADVEHHGCADRVPVAEDEIGEAAAHVLLPDEQAEIAVGVHVIDHGMQSEE